MDQKGIDKKRMILIITFLSMFILGTFLIFTTPSSINITYNKTTKTKDGETISFNVFEPNNGKKEKPAIIIGHGFMANKEMLKEYAIELATAGFVAITFDFRGHGQSSGGLNRNLLINDVKAIKKYLENRADIDIEKLGYIGYSMGGYPGNKIVKDDTDFKCFIGIGTSLSIDDDDCVNRTLNILMILAKYDQAFDLKSSKKQIADRLDMDEDDVQVNKLYGSFEDGDATKLYLDDNSDHFLTAYDQDFIREARDWVINTFSNVDPVDQNFFANLRALILMLQLIGGIGFFFLIIEPLSNSILKNNKQRSSEKEILLNDSKEESILVNQLEKEIIRNISLKTIIYSLLLAIPGMILFISFFLFLPLSTAGFALMLLYGQVFGVFVLLWRTCKKRKTSFLEFLKSPFIETEQNIMKLIILGFGLAIILYFILYLSIGLNYLGLVPSLFNKIVWIPIYFLMAFLMYFIFSLLFQEILQKKIAIKTNHILKASFLGYGLQMVYFITYILLICLLFGSFFLIQFLYFAVPMILLSNLISAILYQKLGKQGILVAAIINTLYLTCLICTLSPFMSGFEMINTFTD